MTGRPVILNGLYNVRVDRETVYSYLPYFGRAYSVPVEGGGLNFINTCRDYTVTPGRKGMISVSFDVHRPDDIYTFYIDVYPDGSTNIRVHSVHRQSVSYTGKMSPNG